MKRWLAFFCVLWLCALPVSAATTEEMVHRQAESAGADALTEALPADVQELLAQLEWDVLSPETYTQLSFQNVAELTLKLLNAQSSGPMQAMGALVGVVLIAALLSGWEGMDSSLRQTHRSVAVLSAGAVLLVPLFSLFDGVRQTVDQVTVFLSSFAPVYAAVLAVGGRGVGAVSYQTTLLGASQLLVWLVRVGVFPLLTVSLAFGCTGSVAEGFRLQHLSQWLHRTVLWALGLFSTLFSGLMSLQQMVASAGDTLGGRVVKFSLSSFVPVVGGLLSETYQTVLGCTGLLRSTLGGFCLLATALVLVPPLFGCICWNVGLGLARGVAGLFGLEPIESLCATAAGAVKVLIALLSVFGLLMVVFATVVSVAAGR